MGWIVAGLLVVFGIALIAAGSSGSANALFESITGIDVPTTNTNSAGAVSGAASTATGALSNTPPGNQGSVSVGPNQAVAA